MIKKTALGIASAAVITVAALAGTTSSAQAGGGFSFGFSGYGGPTVYFGGPVYHGYYGNPCRHWKRKFNRTGRRYFLRRYNRCMRRNVW